MIQEDTHMILSSSHWLCDFLRFVSFLQPLALLPFSALILLAHLMMVWQGRVIITEVSAFS